MPLVLFACLALPCLPATPCRSFRRADATSRIDNNPDLHFLIVINPNSGPGEPPAPDANYSRELPLFNAKENVTTVGYVRMQYCKRSIEKVYDDVAVYAGWSKDHDSNGIYVEGIFLDEAPNEWTAPIGTYLNSVSEKIKGTAGILGRKLVSRRPPSIKIEVPRRHR